MATKMVTKSIRLSDDEAGALRAFVDLTGEVEASVLKRAMLRGLQELRVEQAILAYLRDGDSTIAAEVAGLPRARFLDVLVERGVPLLSEPSTVREEVAFLAEALGSERLRTALAATEHAAPRVSLRNPVSSPSRSDGRSTPGRPDASANLRSRRGRGDCPGQSPAYWAADQRATRGGLRPQPWDIGRHCPVACGGVARRGDH